MATDFPPVPRRSQVIETGTKNTISKSWDDWFQAIQRAFDSAALEAGRVSLDTQSASVAPTAVASSLAAGLYRLSYYEQITQAAGASSSLQTTFTWTNNAVTQTETTAALTTNTTASHQGAVFPLRVDQSSSVNYAVTYASSGLPVMN